jgi:hypothetical protein
LKPPTRIEEGRHQIPEAIAPRKLSFSFLPPLLGVAPNAYRFRFSGKKDRTGRVAGRGGGQFDIEFAKNPVVDASRFQTRDLGSADIEGKTPPFKSRSASTGNQRSIENDDLVSPPGQQRRRRETADARAYDCYFHKN